MHNNFPNLESYFNAINVYMLGDLLVFDKNCRQADEADTYYPIISGRKILDDNANSPVPYSTVYPQNTGSNPSAGYINNPNPRLTIPLALTLFSVIELLGALYTGRKDPGSTTKNINTFFEKLDVSERPSKKEIKILIKIYRHGMAHQYFAKNQCLLSYSYLIPDMLFITNSPICLNVNYLKKLFISGFNKIQADRQSFNIMESNIINLNETVVI